jgi:hypothetical protein
MSAELELAVEAEVVEPLDQAASSWIDQRIRVLVGTINDIRFRGAACWRLSVNRDVSTLRNRLGRKCDLTCNGIQICGLHTRILLGTLRA